MEEIKPIILNPNSHSDYCEAPAWDQCPYHRPDARKANRPFRIHICILNRECGCPVAFGQNGNSQVPYRDVLPEFPAGYGEPAVSLRGRRETTRRETIS